MIAVEDTTRPARLREILPTVITELIAAGIPEERIRIIVGMGGHAPLDRFDLLKKLGGGILARHEILNHHPYEHLVELGTSARGIPITVNRDFHESDLKLAVGSVLPHPYAGFGGGAKIVLPGVSGIETLEANHRPAVTGVHGGLDNVESNTARQEMEEIALQVGLEFIVNVVTDDRRRSVGIAAGHPVQAHRAAVEMAREVYRTRSPRRTPDVVILNAYPKDTELLQVGNVFNVLRSAPTIPIAPDGVIVVTAACSTGRGYHSLHGPNMRLYRKPIEREYLEGRQVAFFSPALNRFDAEVSFWTGYPFFSRWSGVVRWLNRTVTKARPRVAVFPCAPIQLLDSPDAR